jgi:hypothetical protein
LDGVGDPFGRFGSHCCQVDLVAVGDRRIIANDSCAFVHESWYCVGYRRCIRSGGCEEINDHSDGRPTPKSFLPARLRLPHRLVLGRPPHGLRGAELNGGAPCSHGRFAAATTSGGQHHM